MVKDTDGILDDHPASSANAAEEWRRSKKPKHGKE
jgi:hypothetical protein